MILFEKISYIWSKSYGRNYPLDITDWVRKDEEVGIDVSKQGWDSEMIEYLHVFDHKAKRYMFYNGNKYGKTGFGLAVLEND